MGAVTDGPTERNGRWNHNIHYHPLLLRAVPANPRTALDVGCGEGLLTRELAGLVPSVVGIDADAASIEAARAQVQGRAIEYILGDFMRHPFGEQTFDVITSVATVHHLDATAALTRMRALPRPGGVVAILGLAGGAPVRDLPWEAAAAVAHRAHLITKTYWEHPSPTVSTAPSHAQMRRIAASVLPGCRFRRHLLWRYSIVWTKPLDL